MNYFDEARGLRAVIDMRSMTQSDIAKSMGVSQSYVANKLRLLKFPPYIQSLIAEKGLTERHARTLLRLAGEEAICLAIEKICAMHLNVAESEALVDNMLPKREEKYDSISESECEIRERLERQLNAALLALGRLGVKASREVSTYGNKKYITVCIEE